MVMIMDKSDANLLIMVGIIMSSIAYGFLNGLTYGFLVLGIGLITFGIASKLFK